MALVGDERLGKDGVINGREIQKGIAAWILFLQV
jgi:hypothetical protein